MGSHVKKNTPELECWGLKFCPVYYLIFPYEDIMELGVNVLSNQLSRTIGQNKYYDDQYTMCSFLFIQWVIFRKIYADF